MMQITVNLKTMTNHTLVRVGEALAWEAANLLANRDINLQAAKAVVNELTIRDQTHQAFHMIKWIDKTGRA